MHFGTSKLLSDFLGGGGHLPNSGSLFFPWISCPQILQLLFVYFSILGLIFPPISNCIISACHFHILLLYNDESPQIIAFSLWCFCFMLVLWSHVWHIEIVSWSLLFLFFDICYLLLWLSTSTLWNGQIKCFSILFLPPLGSNCLVKISIKYFWQNHLMNCGFYSQKIWQTYLECICIFFSFKAMIANECHIFIQNLQN